MNNPTDWDQHYLDGHTPWDKGEAAPPLVQWLETNSMSGEVLVPGCGMGHDCRAISKANPSSRVMGFDLSAAAIERASAFPTVNGEIYREGDLFQLPKDLSNRFDWIWEHTCFCAIDPAMRDAYVKATASSLKAGGHLLGVFYLDPYDEEHRPGEGPPHGTALDELKTHFIENGQFELIEHWVPTASYPGREGLEMMMLLKKNE